MVIRGATRILTGGLFLLLAACASGPRIETFHDYNPAIDFSAYRTWSWISQKPMIISMTSKPFNPLVEEKLRQAVREALEQKGFRYVDDPETADMTVSFTVGSRDQIDVNQYPVNYRATFGRYRGPYGFGVGYGTETVVREYTEGQLAIDIFDVKSHAPAYHGVASTRIKTSDRKKPEPLARAVIAEALEAFPPDQANGNVRPDLVPAAQ